MDDTRWFNWTVITSLINSSKLNGLKDVQATVLSLLFWTVYFSFRPIFELFEVIWSRFLVIPGRTLGKPSFLFFLICIILSFPLFKFFRFNFKVFKTIFQCVSNCSPGQLGLIFAICYRTCTVNLSRLWSQDHEIIRTAFDLTASSGIWNICVPFGWNIKTISSNYRCITEKESIWGHFIGSKWKTLKNDPFR